MKFFPFINHFIIKPQGNDIHRYKHMQYYVTLTLHYCDEWPRDRHFEKQCFYTCTNLLLHPDLQCTYCIIYWVLYACRCMCVHADVHMFLCAKVQPGSGDSSLWLLSHSQSTLWRREISSISSFMWCGTAEGWGGENKRGIELPQTIQYLSPLCLCLQHSWNDFLQWTHEVAFAVWYIYC